MRRTLTLSYINRIVFCFSALLLLACSKKETRTYTEQEVILEWSKMATYITQFTPANSPTFASRGFGYIGYPGRIGMPPEITTIELVSA